MIICHTQSALKRKIKQKLSKQNNTHTHTHTHNFETEEPFFLLNFLVIFTRIYFSKCLNLTSFQKVISILVHCNINNINSTRSYGCFVLFVLNMNVAAYLDVCVHVCACVIANIFKYLTNIRCTHRTNLNLLFFSVFAVNIKLILVRF